MKADGLAAGKGVILCNDAAEGDRAIDGMLEGGDFGAAGQKVPRPQYAADIESSQEVSRLADEEGALLRPGFGITLSYNFV